MYWGASNIDKHIPTTCYIDKRRFDTYESLYEFISNMDNETYDEYLLQINNFLHDQEAYQFSSAFLIDTIMFSLKEEMLN